jgi:hypothetical protein
MVERSRALERKQWVDKLDGQAASYMAEYFLYTCTYSFHSLANWRQQENNAHAPSIFLVLCMLSFIGTKLIPLFSQQCYSLKQPGIWCDSFRAQLQYDNTTKELLKRMISDIEVITMQMMNLRWKYHNRLL